MRARADPRNFVGCWISRRGFELRVVFGVGVVLSWAGPLGSAKNLENCSNLEAFSMTNESTFISGREMVADLINESED